MNVTVYSKIKADKATRLVVGLSKYNNSSLLTNMTNISYPFDTAAFVVNDVQKLQYFRIKLISPCTWDNIFT